MMKMVIVERKRTHVSYDLYCFFAFLLFLFLGLMVRLLITLSLRCFAYGLLCL